MDRTTTRRTPSSRVSVGWVTALAVAAIVAMVVSQLPVNSAISQSAPAASVMADVNLAP